MSLSIELKGFKQKLGTFSGYSWWFSSLDLVPLFFVLLILWIFSLPYWVFQHFDIIFLYSANTFPEIFYFILFRRFLNIHLFLSQFSVKITLSILKMLFLSVKFSFLFVSSDSCVLSWISCFNVSFSDGRFLSLLLLVMLFLFSLFWWIFLRKIFFHWMPGKASKPKIGGWWWRPHESRKFSSNKL